MTGSTARRSTIRRARRILATLGVAGALVGLCTTAGTQASASTTAAARPKVHAACDAAPAGQARCYAEYLSVPASTTGRTPATPRPLSAADIRKAYSLPAGGGRGATVAIVDAQDNPNAESDLAMYRARNNLPACTTANGCFRKVNEHGLATPLPMGDTGWGLEIALDLDAVSAACPHCKILLVEADTPQLDDLGTAVQTAVALHASVVSNSYGSDEGSTTRADAKKYFTHPGVPIFASTGDDGFEQIASFPAVAPTVIAVGGTTVTPAPHSRRGYTEAAWAGAGSGCSAYVPKPSWQKDTHCLYRTIADVAADADSASGLLVQDTYGFDGVVQVGGTSLSSPLVAAMTAMTNTSKINNASYIYKHRRSFYDVSGGTNGYCGGDYLCLAKTGYDGPTGIGTPHGITGLGPAA